VARSTLFKTSRMNWAIAAATAIRRPPSIIVAVSLTALRTCKSCRRKSSVASFLSLTVKLTSSMLSIRMSLSLYIDRCVVYLMVSLGCTSKHNNKCCFLICLSYVTRQYSVFLCCIPNFLGWYNINRFSSLRPYLRGASLGRLSHRR
jgi:hypothetical protein